MWRKTRAAAAVQGPVGRLLHRSVHDPANWLAIDRIVRSHALSQASSAQRVHHAHRPAETCQSQCYSVPCSGNLLHNPSEGAEVQLPPTLLQLPRRDRCLAPGSANIRAQTCARPASAIAFPFIRTGCALGALLHRLTRSDQPAAPAPCALCHRWAVRGKLGDLK